MAIGGESAGLLFKIKGDSTDAVAALNRVQRESNDLTGTAKGLSSSLSGLAGPASIAVAGITAIAAAALSASVAIFELTKNAAEFGSMIFDASQKTGLGAETLSALKFAADQSGSSFEQVTKGITVFGVEVGKAAQGNEKAAEKMANLGVKSNDLDTALAQVFKTINAGKTDTDKLALATEAFGKRIGPDLIPLIKDADGNLEKLRQSAKDLGVTIDDEAARAADEFGDALDLLGAQAAGVGRQFATELMPLMTSAMSSISEFMTENQGVAKAWGQEVVDIAYGIGVAFQLMERFVTNSLYSITAGLVDLQQSGLFQLYKTLIYDNSPVAALAEIGRAKQRMNGLTGSIGAVVAPSALPATFPGGGGRRRSGGGGGGADKAKREAEQREKAELQAQIELQKIALADLEKTYKDSLDRIRAEFKKTGDDTAFILAANAANKELADSIGAIVTELDRLESVQGGKGTPSQLEVLAKRQAARRAGINELGTDALDANSNILATFDEKMAEASKRIFAQLKVDAKDAFDAIDDDLKESANSVFEAVEANKEIIRSIYTSKEQKAAAQQSILEDLSYLSEFLNDLALNRRNRLIADLEDERTERKKNIEATIRDERERLIALEALEQVFANRKLNIESEFQKEKVRIEKEAMPTIIAPAASPIEGFGDNFINQGQLALVDTMTAAFQGLGEAVGQALEAWVLFGNAGGGIQKFAAQMLASIAKMAAIQSIYEFAQGLSKLAMAFFGHPTAGPSATQHFAASAAFAAVAGVAAVAGRAVAGDSFKKQSGAATGTASGSSNGTGQGENGNEFRGQFNGFQDGVSNQNGNLVLSLNTLIGRQTFVLGQLQQTQEKFATRIQSLNAGDVVTMGAQSAKRAIFDATVQEMNDNPRAGNEFARAKGEQY